MTNAFEVMPVAADLLSKICLVTWAVCGIRSTVSEAFLKAVAKPETYLKAGAKVVATDLRFSQQMQGLVKVSSGRLRSHRNLRSKLSWGNMSAI